MGEMRDSDWSRQILLRSDWLGPSVALITTKIEDKIKLTHFHNCAKMQRNRLQW